MISGQRAGGERQAEGADAGHGELRYRDGPNLLVHEEGADALVGGVLYNRMTLEELDRVIEKHLVGGMVVRVLMNRPPVK